ncbi:hypothetical protein [Bradyrhizobium oligotrophicum]|uniref:hypothetical protein n=1 Tax=Bradyrhizobium oligotrophicum TaxID=44255 RepID=UPI003EB997DA
MGHRDVLLSWQGICGSLRLHAAQHQAGFGHSYTNDQIRQAAACTKIWRGLPTLQTLRGPYERGDILGFGREFDVPVPVLVAVVYALATNRIPGRCRRNPASPRAIFLRRR